MLMIPKAGLETFDSWTGYDLGLAGHLLSLYPLLPGI